eukprot:1143350-Pelagomonas_calceolata.AAC.4
MKGIHHDDRILWFAWHCSTRCQKLTSRCASRWQDLTCTKMTKGSCGLHGPAAQNKQRQTIWEGDQALAKTKKRHTKQALMETSQENCHTTP